MRNITIASFLFFFVLSINAQKKLKKKLDSITTTERAEAFLETHKNRKNKLITFNEEKHKTRLAQELLEMNRGASKMVKGEIERVHYKIIEKNRVPHFRVSFIYLDGKIMPLKEINQMRTKIISQYKNGASFSKLAKAYSMDRSAKQGGDLGWTTYGELTPEFEAAATDSGKNVDDIYTIDLTSEQKYYVVLKTHEPKDIIEIKVLKAVELRKR